MATVRKVTVEKEGNGWRWKWLGRVWQFRLRPTIKLFRSGVAMEELIDEVPLLCLDDAVVYSKGFETAFLYFAANKGKKGDA